MRSLVIEDEPQIGAYVSRLLGQLHGIVDLVGSIADARQALDNFKYDLAIVDRMLPDGDALQVVTALSQSPDRPAIIMLTSKDAKEDVVDGLNSGADDYLGKPFEPQELIARVRALLRRASPERVADVLTFDDIGIDREKKRVSRGGREVELGPTEYRLLAFLMTHPDRVYARSQLLDRVWGGNVYVEERTVDVHIRRLRKSLEPSGYDRFVQTVRGAGYKMRDAP